MTTPPLLAPHQCQYVAWLLTRRAAGDSVESLASRDIKQRNLGYSEQEVQKLDACAHDLKPGLEQQIEEIDHEIEEVRRTAATSPTQSELFTVEWELR